MGMSIEEVNIHSWEDWCKHMNVIPKAEYENRLKADMVNILEEIKKEITELPFPQREPEYMQGYSYCQMNILDYVIQYKINTLRGEEE